MWIRIETEVEPILKLKLGVHQNWGWLNLQLRLIWNWRYYTLNYDSNSSFSFLLHEIHKPVGENIHEHGKSSPAPTQRTLTHSVNASSTPPLDKTQLTCAVPLTPASRGAADLSQAQKLIHQVVRNRRRERKRWERRKKKKNKNARVARKSDRWFRRKHNIVPSVMRCNGKCRFVPRSNQPPTPRPGRTFWWQIFMALSLPATIKIAALYAGQRRDKSSGVFIPVVMYVCVCGCFSVITQFLVRGWLACSYIDYFTNFCWLFKLKLKLQN